MRFFYWLRIHFKNLVCRFRCLDNFCDDCGRRAQSFRVENGVWMRIVGDDCAVLCYDCFCERAKQKGEVGHFHCVDED